MSPVRGMPLAAGQILLSSIDQLTVSDRDSDRQLAKNYAALNPKGREQVISLRQWPLTVAVSTLLEKQTFARRNVRGLSEERRSY